MNSDLIDPVRLAAAYEKARLDLLQERRSQGYWEGQLAASALSTATAISALTLVQKNKHRGTPPERGVAGSGQPVLVRNGVRWLAACQNEDGGWGDTDRSLSNIATTMLVVAALHLADAKELYPGLLSRADRYIDQQGRVQGLRRRYGKDKTFAVPILTNGALAGQNSWQEVQPLPFELACFPQSMYRFLGLPVVSYAIPALVAVGQARFHHLPPSNPLTAITRRLALTKSLRVLERMQPSSGGFLEAIPLTSFVAMSLASVGQADHPVTRRAVDFLVSTVRDDGSWPIDTNLSTWNTTLALNALSESGEEICELGSLDWLLSCQHLKIHPFTGAAPGGWGWSDLSGAVPDSDDTPGALLVLAACWRAPSCSPETRRRIEQAAHAGLVWLLNLQNRNGGWPTFCRGWGKLPFDRSGADLTAHCLRALECWRGRFADLEDRASRSIKKGFRYLSSAQQSDGRWLPLWFGNQDHPREENPVYGTSKVLQAYRAFCRESNGGQFVGPAGLAAARRGLEWLRANQCHDGGWGGGPSVGITGPRPGDSSRSSTVEETALAVDALLRWTNDPAGDEQLEKGIRWLVEAVECGAHVETAPIGFYFAKLWYYEKLYPLIFSVSSLGQATRRLSNRFVPKATSPLTC